MIILLIGFSVFFLDQLTKCLAQSYLLPNKSFPVIENFIHFTLTYNTGAAFGILKGYNILFTSISFVVLLILFLHIKVLRNKRFLIKCAVGLILGGVLGNLLDRIRFGSVIDFIDLRIWPVFNLADSSITIAVSILALLSILARKE